MESLQKIISNPWVYTALVVVLTPFAGALLTSIDRKLTARMQGRIGPSWFQPLYDVAKLFSKTPWHCTGRSLFMLHCIWCLW